MNADKADNVHFEETYENGEMLFDYSLRPGKLSRSNGRNIMAALGLMPLLDQFEEDEPQELRPGGSIFAVGTQPLDRLPLLLPSR